MNVTSNRDIRAVLTLGSDRLWNRGGDRAIQVAALPLVDGVSTPSLAGRIGAQGTAGHGELP
jgi:hypothetical protein